MAKSASFDRLGFACVEPQRIKRQGFPEAIYCPGKTEDQIARIYKSLMTGPGPVIATRITASAAERLMREFPESHYDSQARIVLAKPAKRKKTGLVLVLSAGTADIPVAQEALVTTQALGASVQAIFDVGVSAIDRVLGHRELITKASVCIVCAGMDGALPSVVAGLATGPVIAVPTSTGYGANFNGMAPLLTMLNACAPNVSVVNIDNGFGAGVLASLMAHNSKRT
jgi:pyridinium-3,5-biscarboxylic acid mononucleotide synthase